VPNGSINAEQYAMLLRPLNGARVASRSGGGGKQLSYLEAWDVRAHLIRIFGFGNFDSEILSADLVYQRDRTMGNGKEGWEVAYKVLLQLTVRDDHGHTICRHTEAAVGSADGSVGLGDLHDNAVKQAASDALKRCAINLGTSFGLSLYNNGSRADVVKRTLVVPDGVALPESQNSEQQIQALKDSLGAQTIGVEEPNPDHTETNV